MSANYVAQSGRACPARWVCASASQRHGGKSCPNKVARPGAREDHHHSRVPCASGRAFGRVLANVGSGRFHGSRTNGRRAFRGPESCRKIRTPTLRLEHFRRRFSAGKRGLGALAPVPLVLSLSCHTSTTPWSFYFALVSFAAGAAARASAGQTHFTPEAAQFALSWKVFVAEAEPFVDRCMQRVRCMMMLSA